MIVRFIVGGYVSIDGDEPQIGAMYKLEELSEGSEKQTRAFRALVEEYYKSGCWSYEGSGYKGGCTLEEFYKLIKKKLGEGFECFYFAMFDPVDGTFIGVYEEKRYSDIPKMVRENPEYSKLIRARLKSWSDYTRKERNKTIDNLIAEMHQTGVNTKHFHEILEGMERGKSKDAS